jgi:hypothetical protein
MKNGWMTCCAASVTARPIWRRVMGPVHECRVPAHWVPARPSTGTKPPPKAAKIPDAPVLDDRSTLQLRKKFK